MYWTSHIYLPACAWYPSAMRNGGWLPVQNGQLLTCSFVSEAAYCAARRAQTALALPVSTPAWEHDCVSPAPPWALPGTVVAPRSGLTDKREGGRISRCSRFVMGSVG